MQENQLYSADQQLFRWYMCMTGKLAYQKTVVGKALCLRYSITCVFKQFAHFYLTAVLTAVYFCSF